MFRTWSMFLAIAALLIVSVPTALAQSSDEVDYDRKSDNIELVARAQFPQGTDMFFQRRDGLQRVDGRVVHGTRDYLFAGADASSAVGEPPEGTPEGIRIFDVTDPTQPHELVAVDCSGYHADIAVYEDLLIHGIDSARSNEGCDERFDPHGLNQKGEAGVRIFDISDPARPTLVAHLTEEETGTDAHNITTLPWAGVLYIAGSGFTQADTVLSIVDLTEPDFPVKIIPMQAISPTATAECHDIGVANLGHRALAFCAAVEQTFIWDVSDPMQPRHVANVVGPPESIHHGARLAPDGRTLVLNDELGGAAAAPGCLPTTNDPLGALFFYDIGIPELPVYLGSFSTSEAAAKLPCTSHFYNFIPGTNLLTIGWYKSGMIVVDYANRTLPTEHAVFTPTGGDFWAAYYWHGYVYGNSFGGGGLYGGTNEAGGIWVTQLDGVGDVNPSPYDAGVTWAPWTASDPAPGASDFSRPTFG
ncbi:MAG: hypothetical protein KY469_09985 [Actinobacteria bacterium]|nr:hypothetical protein [Actinomycetota bacterium]